MKRRVVGFIPPIVGIEEEFNTFRLTLFYAKHLSLGEEVYLLNEKERMIFGRARVERIEVGKLQDMLNLHAHMNHTEVANDPAGASERLGETLKKIYGPHIATPVKKTVVLYLRRLE